jgi:glutaredoxin
MEVVVFGKEGCHLCDEVKTEIASLGEFGVALTVVDIEKDSALEAKYWMRIPVVTVGGREVFEASMMDLKGMWRKLLPELLKG